MIYGMNNDTNVCSEVDDDALLNKGVKNICMSKKASGCIAIGLLQYRLDLIGLFGSSTGTFIAEGNAQLQSATTI